VEEEPGAVEIRLSRDLTFLGATMMGIGATVGAGIFVLLGFAAGAAGPAILLAVALNGLVAGLTAVTYADLGTTFPEAGGGYLWVREALPNPLAFAAGWMTWFGHMVAGTVAALGFGHFVAWGLEGGGWLGPLTRDGAAILLALVVTCAYVAFGYIGAQARRRGLGAVGFAKLAILVALVAFGLAAFARGPTEAFAPFLPNGTAGVLTAMTLTFIAFQGFEGIAQAGEEVRDPERTIPRAMFLSLAVVVVLYLAVAFVALGTAGDPIGLAPSWRWLEGHGATAIVAVGSRVIPVLGGPLLAVGGLLATLAALNATLFSASRLSFAMGRDHMLPPSLGRVHPRFRAPSSAILVSGVVMVFLVLFSDLRVVATAAGLAFLLAFVFVNVALVRWRVQHPEVRRGFTAPLFPVFPALAIGANLVLVVFLATQPGPGAVAWTVLVLWIGLGLLLYYPFRGRAEIARPLPGRIDVAELLAAEAPPVELEKYRVLVPLRDLTHLALVRLGAIVASARNGELAILNVLEIPKSLPPKAIRFHYVDERIKGLRKAERSVRDVGADTRTVVRIGHEPYEIVLRSIEEEDVNLLVLGWRGGRVEGEFRILGDTIDYLVQRAPCDVVVAKTRGLEHPVRSVLLYARAADHATGATELAAILAAADRAKVTVLDVAEEGKATSVDVHGLAANLRKLGLDVEVRRVAARDPVEAVVAESARHDLLVLGAGERWALSRAAFGPVVDDIATAARCPVLLYRQGPRKTPSAAKIAPGAADPFTPRTPAP